MKFKTIKELKQEEKNIDKKYGNRADEALIAHRLDERIQTLKDVLKEVETWEWLDWEKDLRNKIKLKIQGA